MAARASRGEVRSGWPQTAIVPVSAVNSRVISDISVLLPAPFGPSSAVNRPAGAVKIT